MLTAKDLALIRAALLFFQEENCTGDRSSMKYYFGSDSCRGVITKTVQELRRRLGTCQIQFAIINRETGCIEPSKLYRSYNYPQRRITHQSHVVGTVLLSLGKSKAHSSSQTK